MTHDERISSYIDNELTTEQEQEFLISLAASEGLRKSFRSELVLKNVLHHDEAVTNPPRNMRTAIFMTLGLGATGLASGAMASKATAATSQASGMAGRMAGRTLLRSLFATKMGALITAAGISISALAGYGVHSLVAPQPSAPSVAIHAVVPAATSPAPIVMKSVANEPVAVLPVREEAAVKTSGQHTSHYRAAHRLTHNVQAVKPAAHGVNGTGSVTMEPAIINGK